MAAPPETDYVVVLDALSDVRFPEGGTLTFSNLPTPVGKATVWFFTRFEDRGFDEKVPRELIVEVTGTTAATLNETIDAYANTALSIIPFIALAANASIEDLELRLAYDNTRGRGEREFAQRFVTELEPGAIRFGKPADREAIALLFAAVARHGEQARLRRAAEQYRQALLNWLPGHEVMAIAHLWIAVEALTKIALRRECDTAGVDSKGLAEQWRVELKDLDGEVRRRVIFQGDAEAARHARQASDGFEHGYLDYGQVRRIAGKTREATAGYVRQAIFQLSALEFEAKARLLAPLYAKPLKSWIDREFRCVLVGETDVLALPGERHPKFTRTPELKSLSLLRDGTYHFEMNENFRASLHEGIQFQPRSFGVWGPRDERAIARTMEEASGEEVPD